MTIVSQYIDSTLGRWTHTEWRPARDQILSGVVERIWDFDGMAAHPQERVFPNGLVELIVQLDDRYRDIHGDHTILTPTVCVTGVHARPMVVQAPPRPCRVLGIRLHPAGAWAVLAHPLFELADLTADLRDVLGREAGELAEQCAGVGGGIERVRRVVAWLTRLLHRSSAGRVDPAVGWVAGRIAASAGRTSIAALRAETGVGDAKLVSLFRQQVGVTPKKLARIHRFGHALGLLGRGGSLADLAVTAGYYDQPHMNAEFREMAGLTPLEVLRATRYPNSMSVPEGGLY